jgi:ribosome-binding protein aMBF1 (putative translation factor)
LDISALGSVSRTQNVSVRIQATGCQPAVRAHVRRRLRYVIVRVQYVPMTPEISSVAAIGGWIRSRRKARGLTQQELAELAGVSRPYLSRLENGETTGRAAELDRVLRVFGKRLWFEDVPPGNRWGSG